MNWKVMFHLLWNLVAAGTVFVSWAVAQGDPRLTGTWSTKSHKVFTGPGFYDPVNDKMFEPELTGISYSFTDDGYYEEAYYRAISSPSMPKCPKGIIQWQHGTFSKASNGSLTLTPFDVDGRQLLSDPCAYKQSIYTRYNQSEYFQRYEVVLDGYHNVQRLNLYQFDGSPMNPMYLAYHPPQMLPTQTLNPTASPSITNGPKATSKTKRNLDDPVEFAEALGSERFIPKAEQPDPDKWWWLGLGMTAIGGVGYLCF